MAKKKLPKELRKLIKELEEAVTKCYMRVDELYNVSDDVESAYANVCELHDRLLDELENPEE